MDVKEYMKPIVCFWITITVITIIIYGGNKILYIVETENNNTIETELTIIDKNISNIYINTGKSIVPVKQYKLTVDFSGESYIVSVGHDAYDSIEVGNSAMFICYYNSEQKLLDICLGE